MFSVGLLRLSNVLISLFLLFVVVKLVQFVIDQLRGSRLPRLKGPSNNSPLFGRLRDLLASNDRGVVYQSWAEEYGAVYQIPAQLGERRIIICDPKAIAHFHSKDTFTYHALPFSKKFVKKFIGPGLIYAEREDHRRQRRNLSPAFGNDALRTVTSVFYDCAYKMKANWDSLFESNDEVIIDVQK
ncbi:hypothetical protein AX14_000677, partial [Amanita brunnescens Koide BX004]